MKRTTSLPTSSTTSASVTKLPERLDILTGSPSRNSRTIWTSLTSRSTRPSVSALTAAWTRLTVPAWSAPQMLTRWSAILGLLQMIGGVGAEIGPAAVGLLHRPVLVVAELGRAEQGQLDRLPIVVRIEALAAARARPRRPGPCRAAPPSRGRPRPIPAALPPTRTCRGGCRAGRGRGGSGRASPRSPASRNSGSHSLSGAPTNRSPYSAASSAPTGFR